MLRATEWFWFLLGIFLPSWILLIFITSSNWFCDFRQFATFVELFLTSLGVLLSLFFSVFSASVNQKSVLVFFANFTVFWKYKSFNFNLWYITLCGSVSRRRRITRHQLVFRAVRRCDINFARILAFQMKQSTDPKELKSRAGRKYREMTQWYVLKYRAWNSVFPGLSLP